MPAPTLRRLPLWSFPLAAVVLAFAWQWATVSANFQGNWTALYCTGALQPHPPLVDSERVYLFPNSTGFDGQFYHYVAHDPTPASPLRRYVDDPRLRYRRIFLPFLAYALAAGRPQFVDLAYEALCLCAIALGVYCSCRFAVSAALAPAWGLLFLLMPAVPITLDRLVIDGALAALTAAFLYYGRSPSAKLFLVLACAALTRETGCLLILAYCLHLAWRRQFRTAAIFTASALPAAAWFLYVQRHTQGDPYGLSPVPLSAIWSAILHPATYPPATPLLAAVRAADYLALAGVLLAIALAILFFSASRIPLTAAAFAAMAVFLQRTDHWLNVYDYGRVYTPLLLCLAAMAARARKPWLLAPMLLMLPRIAIQLTPQLLGILQVH